MFVMHKQFRQNPKHIFNDKELPAMGNNSESVVLPVLDCLCNPKAATPHTKTFSMHKKNHFVGGSNNSTPAQQLHKTIKDFYLFVTANEMLEVNDELFNGYIDHLKTQKDLDPKHLDAIIFLSNLQNQFLIQLQENWNNLKISTI